MVPSNIHTDDQAVLANGLPTSMVQPNENCNKDQVVLADGLSTSLVNSNDTPDQAVTHGAEEEVFLEHPTFDDHGCLPFQHSTL